MNPLLRLHQAKRHGLLLVLACLAICSCVDKTQPGTAVNSGTGSTGSSGAVKGSGFDFVRKSVGLPTETLDYAGTSAAALAGAKVSGDIFFGEPVGGAVEIFKRNLASGERTKVTDINQFHHSSLAAAADGSRIVYCRFRKLKDAIDDAYVTYPDPIAVTYSYDLKKKVEERVFDYNAPELRRWRANGVQPFISPDGKTIYVLAYDTDQLLLNRQCEEWLERDQRISNPPADYPQELRDADRELTAQFVDSPLLRARLQETGATLDAKNPRSAQTRQAISQVLEQTGKLSAALLINREGKSSVLPLVLEAEHAYHYHFIVAAGNEAVVVSAQDDDPGTAEAEPLYRVDMQSGQLVRFGEISGLTKLLTLSKDERELLVCLTPIDLAKKQAASSASLFRIKLDGSGQLAHELPGDYLGVVDLDAEGKLLAGQDASDRNLYLVDVEKGSRELINEQLSQLTGLLLTATGQDLVYLEGGVTYRIDLRGDLASKPGRLDASYFKPYETAALEFLKKLGFVIDPAGLKAHWEERSGLGVHEVSAQVGVVGQPDKVALLRYDIANQRFVSLWFPNGYPFPASNKLQGSNFDYYDAEALASRLMDIVGWIPADKRVVYQPGPNPLYDQKSDSYIITYREAYQLANSSDRAFAGEASLRIAGKTGELSEMTFSSAQQVQNQAMKIQRDRLDFLVRNNEELALPQEAPIEVESDKARLVVFIKREQVTEDGKLTGKATPRLCWEVDTVLLPERDLIFTNLIDTETGENLGSLSYMPMAPTATTVER